MVKCLQGLKAGMLERYLFNEKALFIEGFLLPTSKKFDEK